MYEINFQIKLQSISITFFLTKNKLKPFFIFYVDTSAWFLPQPGMSYDYGPPSAISVSQSQSTNQPNNLTNTCTISSSHKNSCRTTPYTIRHKYLQEGNKRINFKFQLQAQTKKKLKQKIFTDENVDPYNTVPILHSAYVTTGWSRSPEPLAMPQEWPASPLPSPTSSSPSGSAYTHVPLGRHSSTSTPTTSCTFYIPPVPACNSSPHEHIVESSSWLHPSSGISDQSQQQSYLNLNLHLHHQIPTYSRAPSSSLSVLQQAGNEIGNSSTLTTGHEYATTYHQAANESEQHHHHQHQQSQLIQLHSQSEAPSPVDYDPTKNHHGISGYQEQNQDNDDARGVEDDRRYVNTVIDHRHQRDNSGTGDETQNGWTPLTPPAAAQNTII